MAMRADSLRPASVAWKVAGLVLMLNQKTELVFSCGFLLLSKKALLPSQPVRLQGFFVVLEDNGSLQPNEYRGMNGGMCTPPRRTVSEIRPNRKDFVFYSK